MLKKLIFGLVNRYGDKSHAVVNQYANLNKNYPSVITDIAHRGYVFHTTADKNISQEQILINEGRRQLALEILRLCDPELPNIIYQHLNTKKRVNYGQ